MKKIGIQPIPMMDRDKKNEVPQGQVRPHWGISECVCCTFSWAGHENRSKNAQKSGVDREQEHPVSEKQLQIKTYQKGSFKIMLESGAVWSKEEQVHKRWSVQASVEKYDALIYPAGQLKSVHLLGFVLFFKIWDEEDVYTSSVG